MQQRVHRSVIFSIILETFTPQKWKHCPVCVHIHSTINNKKGDARKPSEMLFPCLQFLLPDLYEVQVYVQVY